MSVAAAGLFKALLRRAGGRTSAAGAAHAAVMVTMAAAMGVAAMAAAVTHFQRLALTVDGLGANSLGGGLGERGGLGSGGDQGGGGGTGSESGEERTTVKHGKLPKDVCEGPDHPARTHPAPAILNR